MIEIYILLARMLRNIIRDETDLSSKAINDREYVPILVDCLAVPGTDLINYFFAQFQESKLYFT